MASSFARELVNEPPNVLFPAEFARRATELRKLGVQVEVLDEPMLKKLGMRALLAVGQGSERDSRLVIMRWNGAKKKSDNPVAIIGKGVCFDTGGISIKPAASMEDMKGDMAGAACVTGLMHALASRKAKANVVGVIGLVENMPDGNAYRPGDILKSYSGQTIEVINTDAEGRLVLCDALAYTNERFKPKLIDRSCDANRRDPDRARAGTCGPVLERRQARRPPDRRGPRNRRDGVAHAAGARLRQNDRLEIRRHEKHRRPLGGLDHCRAIPAALCRQNALGASRYRGHRHGGHRLRDQ